MLYLITEEPAWLIIDLTHENYISKGANQVSAFRPQILRRASLSSEQKPATLLSQ